MQNITIERSEVNIDALSTALRIALGTATSGFSTMTGRVIVHLVDNATPQQIALAERIVRDHDASKLTVQQQKQSARQDRLTQMRPTNANELNLDDFTAQSAAIRALAQKVAWLEAELLELLGV